MRIESVARVACPTLKEFFQEIRPRRQPVVLTGCADRLCGSLASHETLVA